MHTTPLHVKAGRPFTRRLRVTFPVARDYWLALTDFEVLGQIRAGDSEDTRLFNDLAEYMTPSLDGNDIVIDWSMTGEDTRTLSGGHYDILVSDPGTTDGRAVVVLKGRIWVEPIVTAAQVGG